MTLLAQPPRVHGAEPDPAWRIVWTPKRCRHGHGPKRCTAKAVAEMNRSKDSTGQQVWWAYCPSHMYGRWVSAGVVMRRTASRPSETEGAPR